MRPKTKPYDVAGYLNSTKMIAVYLDAAFASGDPSRVAAALGDVMRAHGTFKIARAAGLGRAQLKTLSAEDDPTLATVLKVLAALGGGLRPHFPKIQATKIASRASRRRRGR